MKFNTKFLISVIILSSLVGAVVGVLFSHQIAYSSSNFTASIFDNLKNLIPKNLIPQNWFEKATPTPAPTPAFYEPDLAYEQRIIDIVEQSANAVVSIIVSKDVPIFEQYYTNPFGNLPQDWQEFFGPFFQFNIPQYRQKGTEKKEIGGGTGFIISSDGLILTNKHVVNDKDASYTVYLNNGTKYDAKVLALDPIDDIALIKIEAQNLKTLKLGDSDGIKVGQTVIAIGNALGEFRNTVSVGVVSGLSRSVMASDAYGNIESIDNVIQTDAAINLGNSGGPLINLKGEVIGINTAIASGAENIGFAIPINRAKKALESYQKFGKITAPFIGIKYTIVNSAIQKQNNLSVDYGAWINSGSSKESAIISGSPAEKAGLKEGDIILEFNGEKITATNTLTAILKKYKVGDKVNLKVLRDKQEINIELILGERPDNF
ncbi:MAG: trypsin-like peptidase domain-containing protein [Patescibacteria group bacterium]|jgi:serine protease Do|nr:trypsin-like peptidase domain-containing protein [Patescibacteria group bacterium]